MNRDTAIGLLDRLHKAQNDFYAGGSGAALQQLLGDAESRRSARNAPRCRQLNCHHA